MTQYDTPRCYICERALNARFEKDHFPVPKSLGGKTIMPCCISCHDDKDRVTVGNWNPEVAFTAFLGLWQKASRDERLLLAKIFQAMSQGSAFSKKQNQQDKTDG